MQRSKGVALGREEKDLEPLGPLRAHSSGLKEYRWGSKSVDRWLEVGGRGSMSMIGPGSVRRSDPRE